MTTTATPEAEQSVIGHMLAEPQVIGEVVGSLLAAGQFADPGYRCLYAQIVDQWHEDRATDPLTIGRLAAKTLSRSWECEDGEVIARVQSLASHVQGDVLEHAGLIQRDHSYRELAQLARTTLRDVSLEVQSPDELAGQFAQSATEIAIGNIRKREIVSFADLGREFVAEQRHVMEARRAGIELGAYFGMSFLDSYVKGLLPTELFFLAGEPGAGKSSVAWKAAMNFAERQLRKPVDQRVGALVLSLEMGQRPSSIRMAQALAKVEGGQLREGKNSDSELDSVIFEWGQRKDLPLFFNFTSTLRSSQLKALVVESVRRHNVGLVVIDHMRYFDMDGRYGSKLEEDEDKARFLKQQLAKDLNIAVMCLAHTTKGIESTEDRRPRLSHLRGSGQIAAEADFVAFVHRPYNHASEADRSEGAVVRTDAELIYAKNRHGVDATADFYFDPSTLTIYTFIIALLIAFGNLAAGGVTVA